MPSGRIPNPNTLKEKSKKRISLSADFQIIKDLVVVMRESGWNQNSDKFTITFEKEEARLFYSRRTNSLQLYWKGYGTQAIEADLFSFESLEAIVKWSEQLNDIELISPLIDLDDLEDLDPMDIINRIFD